MSHRCLAAVFTVIAVVALATSPIAAQTAPRTPWGAPDLGGVWDFRTITPLERPDEFAGQDVLTAEESAAREARAIERNVDRPPPPGSTGGYNRFWVDTPSFVDNTRTSLIEDPPDGKLPSLVPGASEQRGSPEPDPSASVPFAIAWAGVASTVRKTEVWPSGASLDSHTGHRCCPEV